MDGNRFDRLVQTLAIGETRRWLVGALAGVPLAGVLGLLGGADEVDAKGRRRRRKKRHKHGQDPPRNRKGKRKGRGKGKRRKRRNGQGNDGETPCQADPRSVTCADRCGSVENNCGETVDCGLCACEAEQTRCGNACIVEGQPCEGSAVGACVLGTLACVGDEPQCVGAVGPSQEVCNGIDDDCDGVIDNGAVCPDPPNATGFCFEGSCQILQCQEGFANCDGINETGCEINLQTDPNNCDTCGRECECPVGEFPICTGGVCGCDDVGAEPGEPGG